MQGHKVRRHLETVVLTRGGKGSRKVAANEIQVPQEPRSLWESFWLIQLRVCEGVFKVGQCHLVAEEGPPSCQVPVQLVADLPALGGGDSVMMLVGTCSRMCAVPGPNRTTGPQGGVDRQTVKNTNIAP